MNRPQPLIDFLETLAMFPDRTERIQALISVAERFSPPEIEKPYEESHRVPGCESEAFVWASGTPESVTFEYAVENPQGISAMALATILKETLGGLSAEAIQGVDEDVVYEIFGRELSMGKSMGLTGMVRMTRELARRVS